MYQMWIWNDEVQQYVPEYNMGKRIEFEHWNDAVNAQADRTAVDGQLRRVVYRGARVRRRT